MRKVLGKQYVIWKKHKATAHGKTCCVLLLLDGGCLMQPACVIFVGATMLIWDDPAWIQFTSISPDTEDSVTATGVPGMEPALLQMSPEMVEPCTLACMP